MNELDDGDFTPSPSSTSLASGEEELTAQEFTDYRVLPPANHPIRRSYHQYRGYFFRLLEYFGSGVKKRGTGVVEVRFQDLIDTGGENRSHLYVFHG